MVSEGKLVTTLAVDDLFVTTGTREDKTAGKARRALGVARDQLEALMKSASTGVPRPKPYNRGAFAAEAVSEAFIETLRALAGAIEAFLIEQSSRETALPWLEPYFAVLRFLQVSDAFDETYRIIIDPGNQIASVRFLFRKCFDQLPHTLDLATSVPRKCR